jgi:hypothetical protein
MQSEGLSEKEKNSESYLVNCVDSAIADLVYDKDELRKAYNYYNGNRDKDQFRHLEENFNIGTPTSVEFIPLVRRHIDVLIGEHLQNKLKPKVTCKDKKTLNAIFRKKQQKIDLAEMDRLKSQLHTNISYAIQKQVDVGLQPPIDHAAEAELMKLKEDIDKNFVSEYEIAAQNVLTHLVQSKVVDLYNKLKILFLDILVAGQCYYKVSFEHKGETPDIEVLNPFDVFYERNVNSVYVKDSPRSVVRRWMNRQQILNKYGHLMDKDALEELDGMEGFRETDNVYYIRSTTGGLVNNTDVTVIPGYPYMDNKHYMSNLIPVYEVEWLSNNKVDINGTAGYRLDRYQGVRIGTHIFLDMGKSDNVVRTMEHPYRCAMSVNGLSYSDRNGKAYSLVLATANLQDKYDMLHFFRDNLIATSGVKGGYVDVSQLPEFLGSSPPERLLKFMAYSKQGIKPINTAQEGRQGGAGANHNTIYAGYDETVSGQSIQAIQLAISQTEDICSAITGVFRERLGGIEQRDAVTNVEVGVKQSAIITKQYYQVMDNITTELLIDSLNMCKISYADGMVGSTILGNKLQKIFTVDPKLFSFTDYDVHIADSGDIIREVQEIKNITMELIKSGSADIDIILETIGSESMTEMKESVSSAVKRKLEENNQVKQLDQQLKQAEQQLKQLQQQAQQLQQENDSYKKKDLDVKNKAVEYDYEVKKEQIEVRKDYETEKIALQKDEVDLQKLQLFDGNPNNDAIKNI